MSTSEPQTAARVIERLDALRSDDERRKIQRYFKTGPGEYGEGDVFIGIRMGSLFAVTEDFVALPLTEVEVLLESEVHEHRAAAVKVMARKAGARRATDDDRRALHDLYLRRHDRINSWDLVDLGAWHVVGRYLLDHDRSVLADLAASDDLWERRTAILATLAFIRGGELDDTFALAAVLVPDHHDLTQKAVGGTLRAAGKVDRARLLAFLDVHAPAMGRTALTFAMEHLDADTKAAYRALR